MKTGVTLTMAISNIHRHRNFSIFFLGRVHLIPILSTQMNCPVGSEKCGSGSQDGGQAADVNLELLYKR